MASYYCTYNSGVTTGHTWCSWGCCNTGLLNPCCAEPVYESVPFIAGITCGSITLIFLALAVLIYRRWKYNTTVRYVPSPIPHVFSTTASTSSHAGHSNPGFTSTTQAYN